MLLGYVFCRIVDRDGESEDIYEDNHVVKFLDAGLLKEERG